MIKTGLTSKEVEISRKVNGSNKLTEIKRKTFLGLLLESLGDPIIKILMLALVIKIVFLFKDFDWFETIGILIAILLSSFISTISEYGSEETFKRLQEDSESVKVKVKRNGSVIEIPLDDVVVGDLVILESGDLLPADGRLISGSLSVDESRLNGESKEQKKTCNNSKNAILYRGSVVYEGQGVMEVTLVGDKTMYGMMAHEVQEGEPVSPLKLRLRGLAKTISRLGYIGAFLVTLSYLFSVIVMENNFEIPRIIATVTNTRLMLDYLIYALTLSVTIIVVAVPEGLPMMITIVLSSNMKRMLKSNVLVRKLVGIETTGSMNMLFTDKTGTLTKGVLEVLEIVNGEAKHFKSVKDLRLYPNYQMVVKKSFIWNNQSFLNDKKEVLGGNSTDRAMYSFFLENYPCPYEVAHKTPFNSEQKYSSITVLENNREITYYKGASEVIIPKCYKYLSFLGEEKPFLNKENTLREIDRLTKKGSRVISMSYGTKDSQVFVGFVLLKDEIRKEAREAVCCIQNAGIDVVMITGDAKETAVSIAKEVGIIRNEKDIVLTSGELNNLSDYEIEKKLPNIKVIARALPTDKSRLVNLALNKDLIVGMTGDGVNDAPALKKANVGFAMGSGTEVAKEASDIVILDDNILSIKEAILYGRTIFKSIRKFIIYQLTCNFCALFLSIIGPFIGVTTPITIIQMLWINMIMDTFAGIAFSFEPALAETMGDAPKKKDEPILNRYMYSEIIFTGFYSALLCVMFLKSPFIKNLIRYDVNNKYLMTAYFALFIFIGIFNAFNARTHRLNLLSHIKENIVFVLTILFIVSVQIILIYKGGSIFRTFGLTPFELMLVIVLSFSVVPIDLLRKVILKKKKIKLGV